MNSKLQETGGPCLHDSHILVKIDTFVKIKYAELAITRSCLKCSHGCTDNYSLIKLILKRVLKTEVSGKVYISVLPAI